MCLLNGFKLRMSCGAAALFTPVPTLANDKPVLFSYDHRSHRDFPPSASSYFMTVVRDSGRFADTYITITLIIVVIYLTIGVFSLVVFMKNHSNKISLPLYEMYLNRRERFMCCVTNPSMIMWVSFAVMQVVINLGGVQ